MQVSNKREYKRNIVLDYLHKFFRNTNFTHGIWAAYLLTRGFTLIDVGVFELVFHISSLLMEVPTGVIGDVFGRKTSRVLGIISYLVYIVIMLFSSNYLLIMLAFWICGLSYTFESGSGDAMVYDSLKELGEEQSFMKVNGIKEVIYQVATVLVLFLTGLLLEGMHHTDYYLTAGMMVIALVTIFMMKETQIQRQAKKQTVKERLYNHFVKTWNVVSQNKRLLTLIVIGSLLFAPVTSQFIYAQEYFIYNGFSEKWMLYFLAMHALFAAIGGFLAEKIESKIGEKKLLVIVPLIYLVSFWMVLIPTYGFIGFVILGFFDSLLYVVLFDYVNRLIPSETRASVLSFFGMCFSIVMIVIFPIMGIIGETFSIFYSYLFLSIIVTIVVINLINIVLRKKHLQ